MRTKKMSNTKSKAGKRIVRIKFIPKGPEVEWHDLHVPAKVQKKYRKKHKGRVIRMKFIPKGPEVLWKHLVVPKRRKLKA